MLSDRRSIREALDQYRQFQECLLREVRLTNLGRDLELEFAYIWGRGDDDEWRVVDEPSTVILRLAELQWAEIRAQVPAAVREEPERADWGLTEIALVRVEQAPQDAAQPAHHLVVVWEDDRRIDAVFGGLAVDNATSRGALE